MPGALAGVIDGYPQSGNGNWFLMALSVASYEYKNMGISLTLIPAYKNTVHGSLSLQPRLKVFQALPRLRRANISPFLHNNVIC
jgi:hypothetical protein